MEIQIITTIFELAALVLAIITVLLVMNTVNKFNNYDKCTGVIIKIKEDDSGPFHESGEKLRYPIVQYNIDGLDYENKLNYYSSSMRVGQKVELLYNKNDYANVHASKGLILVPIITGVLVLGFVIATIILVLVS